MKFIFHKQFFWLATLCLSLIAGPVFAGELENKITAELSKPADQIDLTRTLLWVSKKWNPGLDLRPLEAKIDALADKLRNQQELFSERALNETTNQK